MIGEFPRSRLPAIDVARGLNVTRTGGTTVGDERYRKEAAALLRRLIEAVDRGELTATTPQARALLRHLEGAASALTALDDERAKEP